MPEPSPGQSESRVDRHRPYVISDDTGHYGICACGWRERFHFLLAARREVKAHRRHGGPNPRLRTNDGT